MKSGYNVQYGEIVGKPNFISVSNFGPLNSILILYWHSKESIGLGKELVGVWKIKYKHK